MRLLRATKRTANYHFSKNNSSRLSLSIMVDPDCLVIQDAITALMLLVAKESQNILHFFRRSNVPIRTKGIALFADNTEEITVIVAKLGSLRVGRRPPFPRPGSR